MNNATISHLIQTNEFAEANKAIRARLGKTNFTEKQVSAMMYYAYESSHAYGEGEMLSTALSLLTDIAEVS